MTHLPALLILCLCLISCLGYGWGWLRLLRWPARRDPLFLLYAVALGMGTLAYLVLAVGLAGWLQRGVLGALVAAGWVPAGVSLLERRKDRGTGRAAGEGGDERHTASAGERSITLLATGFCGLLALATLLSALKPADGLDWDSLSYHLAAPRIYLREGRLSFIAYDSHTQFPFTMEMLYTLGLAFGGSHGGSAAKLFHWAAGWLTALAVGIWASGLKIGGRACPAWSGPAAAAAFASMPLVLWELGTAYIDLGASLFQFLALTALIDAAGIAGTPPLGTGPNVRPAVLAGMLSGFALGTKMTALLQFGLLGLGLLCAAWKTREASQEARRKALVAALSFGAVGALVGSPWYLKSWLWVHNPVYPFFYPLFPHSYSWTARDAAAYATEQRSFGLGRGPAALAGLLWNLSLHGRAFFINERSLMGDKVGSLGPLWAGLLPLLMWTRGLGWRVWACLLYAAASVGLWFVLSQQARYLVPVFAPLAAAAAVIPAALPSRPLRTAAGAFIALSLLFNFGMHAPLAATAARVVMGEVDERDYLRASLQGLYEAAEFINQLPADSRVALYQETRGFYFDRRYFWANPLQHNLIPYDRLRDGEELTAHLRRFGITHVLINYWFCRNVEESPWYRLLMDGIQRGRLEELFRSPGALFGKRGVMVYRLR